MRKPPSVRLRLSGHSAAFRSSGFTLLEVLVAIVVLSFGVLGVVGLQAAALQANNETRYQSTAVAMARELADMMRGNKDEAVKGTGSSTATNPYVGDFTASALPTANPTCAPCTSTTEVAQAQLRDWVGRLNAVLPGFRAVICVDKDPYDTNGKPQWGCTTGASAIVVVKIGWTRRAVGAAASAAEAGATAAPLVILPLIAGSSN